MRLEVGLKIVNLAGRVLGQGLLDGGEVLQALRHLAPRNRQVAGVEEIPVWLMLSYVSSLVINQLLSCIKMKDGCSLITLPGPAIVVKVGLTLCQFIIMVGKLEVVATTENIDQKSFYWTHL